MLEETQHWSSAKAFNSLEKTTNNHRAVRSTWAMFQPCILRHSTVSVHPMPHACIALPHAVVGQLMKMLELQKKLQQVIIALSVPS